MAARAYWQGQIRLALVSIPVEIYSATRSGASVSFRQIHEPSGKPIHYEKVETGIGPVDADEIMKGYEFEKGEYVLLDQDEIDAVRLESKKTLELTQFVDASEMTVRVENGEVTLSGTVADRDSKRRAERLAESAGGVSDVQNNIKVRQGASTGSGETSGLGVNTTLDDQARGRA